MKFTSFTLVHERASPHSGAEQFTRGEQDVLQAFAPETLVALKKLAQPFQQTLLSSSFALATDGQSPVEVALPALSQVVKELARAPQVVTVGVWDLNARIGGLPRLIEALNAASPAVAFFDVQAAVPAGLVSKPERVVTWAEEHLRHRLSAQQRADIVSNVIDDDFFLRAAPIRKELGVDYLVGLTASKVAFAEERELYWNYFSSHQRRLVLGSTYELRKFCRKAERPFEVGVGVVMVAQVLVAMNRKLHFHEDRGCLFDTCWKRKALMAVVQEPKLDARCLALISPRYREAAQALVAALKGYQGGNG